MKKIYCLVLITILFMSSCKRSSSCEDRDRDEYYDIPLSTKPYILNKKGEILVFANSKNDTVEFLCTEETHGYKLVSNLIQGSADCPIIVKKYAESFEYNYIGDSAFFGFMRVKYLFSTKSTLLETRFDVNISDSINSLTTLDYFLALPPTDSILFFGKYYLGTYNFEKNILYNSQLGIIKFINNQNESWQLIQKK